MEFGEKLYELRNKAQISQIQLAEDLGVSRQTISKWETGTMFPEIGKLIKISERFNVSTDYLLKETRQKDPIANLDRLVLKFLGSAQDMDVISKELVDIIRDGMIDKDEKERVQNILLTLNEIEQIIDEIRSSLSMDTDL